MTTPFLRIYSFKLMNFQHGGLIHVPSAKYELFERVGNRFEVLSTNSKEELKITMDLKSLEISGKPIRYGSFYTIPLKYADQENNP